MTTLQVGQTVKVSTGSPSISGRFNDYQYLADTLKLPNFQAGKEPSLNLGKVVAVTKHPGCINALETLSCLLVTGQEIHPQQGVEIVAVEIEGVDYIYLADHVEAV